MTILLFILGLTLLIGGAEILVRGASRLAALFGISLHGKVDIVVGFSMAMLYFALSLTAVTFFAVAAREWRTKK